MEFSLSRQWRKKSEGGLDGSYPSRKKARVVRLGGKSGRRIWKIRAVPKLQLFKVASPMKLWSKFKSAYVNMMLSFASNFNSMNIIGGGGGGGGGDNGMRRKNVNARTSKVDELETKLVYEIYKVLMASKELVIHVIGTMSSVQTTLNFGTAANLRVQFLPPLQA